MNINLTTEQINFLETKLRSFKVFKTYSSEEKSIAKSVLDDLRYWKNKNNCINL